MDENFKAPKSVLVTLVILILFYGLPAPLSAQVVGATLTGTVTDASGSSVSGAQISIKNVATGITRELIADSAGFYSAPNLLPGGYAVTVKAIDFRP
jgi:protocatechuate 3,4-dioxygenase beta subunit